MARRLDQVLLETRNLKDPFAVFKSKLQSSHNARDFIVAMDWVLNYLI